MCWRSWSRIFGRAAERVRSFKQVAADQTESLRRSFDAGELTGQVLSQFERQLRVRDIAFSLHCETNLAMDSYPGPFGQVLTNLAVNAMTHAFSDGETGTINVSLRAVNDDHVELLFADDGCGMAPDVERRAFDPFFTTRRHDGASGPRSAYRAQHRRRPAGWAAPALESLPARGRGFSSSCRE